MQSTKRVVKASDGGCTRRRFSTWPPGEGNFPFDVIPLWDDHPHHPHPSSWAARTKHVQFMLARVLRSIEIGYITSLTTVYRYRISSCSRFTSVSRYVFPARYTKVADVASG